jgi:hypothetical protein
MASDSRIYVCERCIEDPDLQEVVREHLISEKCDYCGRREATPIACEFSDVLERIRFVVDQFYTNPSNFVYWNGQEGGWQGHPVHEGWDLFANIGWEVSNQGLMEDIVEAFFGEEFADPDFWPGPLHERQMSSWQRFKRIVKHERRYTFWSVDGEVAEPTPSELLNGIIGDAIQSVALARTLSPGEIFWRVRVHSRKESLNRASEFTSPPASKALIPNRMSPSGIPMFYGADDLATAVEETIDPTDIRGKLASAVAFQSLVPLNILDLTAVPTKIGFFSDLTRAVREAVSFLRAFTQDISRRVKKDGSQQIDYVPTQVFTEFIRYQAKTPQGERFHGIKYQSSRNKKGCYVLFVEQDECLTCRKASTRPQVLSFVSGSRTTVTLSKWRKARRVKKGD